MRKNKQRTPIANNRFSFERFIRLFAAIEVLLVFLYVEYIALSAVRGYRIWILVIAVTMFGVGSLVLSWKLERNWMSLLSSTTIPVLLCEATSMWEYFPLIRITMITGVLIAVVIGCVWAARKVCRIRRVHHKHTVFIIKSAHASRVLCCMFLIGICIYGRGLITNHYSVSYSDIEYHLTGTLYGVPDYENSLVANIETVAKIDPDGGW